MQYICVTNFTENIMDINNLKFLKSQIRVMRPDLTDAQVEIEAIKIINKSEEESEEDGCLYCGS